MVLSSVVFCLNDIFHWRETVYSCSKFTFVQKLISRIKLNITINIGQLTLTWCYTCAMRKHTIFLYKVPLVLSNPALNYMTDKTIIEMQEMGNGMWLALLNCLSWNIYVIFSYELWLIYGSRVVNHIIVCCSISSNIDLHLIMPM